MKKKSGKKDDTEKSEGLDINILDVATSENSFSSNLIYDDLIDEDEEDFFIKTFNTRGKKQGMNVETKLGEGVTKAGDPSVDGKIPVYLNDGRKVLCRPENITIIGFYN